MSRAEWAAVLRDAKRWDGLRLTYRDLERVSGFLLSERGRWREAQLALEEARLIRALEHIDWTDVDPLTLIELAVITAFLRRTLRQGFPPEVAWEPTDDRWRILLYRLIIAAEDAGLDPLALTRQAMSALYGWYHGGRAELRSRLRRHLGAAAVATLWRWVRTGDGADPLAAVVMRPVLQAADKQLGELRWQLAREERWETLTSVAAEEIARRLKGHHDHASLFDALLEALPSGSKTASRWDFLARDTATRVRREHHGYQPPQPEHQCPDEDTDPPDEVAALRGLIDKAQADPKLRAALEAATSRQSRADAARKAGVSPRMLQHYLARFRRQLRGG